MPYTDAQRRLFFAAASNPKVAKKHGMSAHTAEKLAAEAARTKPKPKRTILSH